MLLIYSNVRDNANEIQFGEKKTKIKLTLKL